MKRASWRMLWEPNGEDALSRRTNGTVRREGVLGERPRAFRVAHSFCPSLPTPSEWVFKQGLQYRVITYTYSLVSYQPVLSPSPSLPKPWLHWFCDLLWETRQHKERPCSMQPAAKSLGSGSPHWHDSALSARQFQPCKRLQLYCWAATTQGWAQVLFFSLQR